VEEEGTHVDETCGWGRKVGDLVRGVARHQIGLPRRLEHRLQNVGASPTMIAVHCMRYDARPWYAGHALHPLSRSRSCAASGNQRLLLTSNLVSQPCGPLR
jgi:hypothetical protein